MHCELSPIGEHCYLHLLRFLLHEKITKFRAQIGSLSGAEEPKT